MKLQSDNLFVVFRDGWHETEVGPQGTGQEWQWSRKESTLSFRNPKRDVWFYLQADQPAASAFTEPQHVDVRIGTAGVDSFQLVPGRIELRRVEIPAAALGTGDTVDLTISVDRTFVPASIPSMRSTDPRELGIRVFRAFVQPK
jgi:hypothetical protein